MSQSFTELRVAIFISYCLLASCSCSGFTDANGYGSCQKIMGKGPICYVNKPSICKDLVDSESMIERQYSWEACEKLGGKVD